MFFFGELLGLVFVLQRVHELGQLALHDVAELVQRQVDAVIGDARLRKVVGADALGAVAGAHLQLAVARHFAVALFAARRPMSLAFMSAMARERFLCCERSSWHSTTMPVGRCVMRMADSVLLTCWPPAPEARYVSMRRSAGIEIDGLDFIGLGQDGHGHGRSVDAALRLGGRHALHAMHAGLEFEAREGARPAMRLMTSR